MHREKHSSKVEDEEYCSIQSAQEGDPGKFTLCFFMSVSTFLPEMILECNTLQGEGVTALYELALKIRLGQRSHCRGCLFHQLCREAQRMNAAQESDLLAWFRAKH